MTEIVLVVILPPAAYLLGAIPSAQMIARYFRIHLRHGGSGSIGATQLRRMLRAKGYEFPTPEFAWAAAMISDGLKTFAPVVLAVLILGDVWYPILIAWIACVGHTRSIWLRLFDNHPRSVRWSGVKRFSGGKAVASMGGATLALAIFQDPSLAVALVSALVVFTPLYIILPDKKKFYGSLAGALVGGGLAIALIINQSLSPWYLAFAGLVLFILVLHKGNFERSAKDRRNPIGSQVSTT